MTEKEAWLEIGKMFDSAERTWKYHCMEEPVVGICDALLQMSLQQWKISFDRKKEMVRRLGEYFNPNGKDVSREFFWPENTRRTSRTLRATACGFLAAMCDD